MVAVLLLYPFGAFMVNGRKARQPNWLDRAVLAISSPLQRGLSIALDTAADAWRGYAALRGVRDENNTLQAENQQLRAKVNQLEEARAENERLKRMLGYVQNGSGSQIPARVVGVNPVAAPLSLRIDRGESDGVHRGMPVVTPDGIVGHIHRVSGGYSDVVLITDPNSKIGVRAQRSRARATASGGGGNQTLRLENALRTEDLEEGDLIITSGTDGVYPPGLVVGRITTIQRKSYGMFQAAEIIPAVDIARIEEVLVVLNPTPRPASPAVDGRTVSGGVR
jgi:rod shape-determining protein MreC